MKRFTFILLIITGFQSYSFAQEHRRYAMVWNDEFDTGKLDQSVWSKTKRSHSSWAMHMTSNDALFGFEDGNLVLWGKVNDFLPNDTASVLTGGVWTRRRKAFGFGRLEGVIGEEAVQVRWKEEHCRRQAHVWPISRKG